MTAATIDLKEYEGKKVLLTLADSEEAIQATLVVGSPVKSMYKPKGKSNAVMIDSSDIVKIEIAPETEADLKARRLNHVTLDTVKRHLVDRHGYALKDINDLSPEKALDFHEDLDHAALDLSHFHSDPPAATEEKSEPEAEADTED